MTLVFLLWAPLCLASLKMAGALTWGWAWVTAPAWGYLGVLGLVVVGVMVVDARDARLRRRATERWRNKATKGQR